MSVIERIRDKIRTRDYYLSLHATEELAEDGFERDDMENAVLTGFVQKRLTHDPRGTRYRIEGTAKDGRTMYVLCRFTEIGALVVITVYAKE
ncbi:MAG: DUF4258 domain-containing protein [Thermoguttaceae bacterium]|nr:DUF4258 domain-containing protein [Thermoguttaceae bacterium]